MKQHREERLIIANEILRVISRHGRRFFSQAAMNMEEGEGLVGRGETLNAALDQLFGPECPDCGHSESTHSSRGCLAYRCRCERVPPLNIRAAMEARP